MDERGLPGVPGGAGRAGRLGRYRVPGHEAGHQRRSHVHAGHRRVPQGKLHAASRVNRHG